LAIDGGECLDSFCGRFTPGKVPGIDWVGNWVVRRAVLKEEVQAKMLFPKQVLMIGGNDRVKIELKYFPLDTRMKPR